MGTENARHPPRPGYLANASWLMGDHVLRMVLGFAVNIWVVRYLGAEQFGMLSYALGLLALVSPFTVLGLDGILVRELARKRADVPGLLGTAFVLKLAGAAIALLLVLLDAWLLALAGAAALILVASLSCIFSSLNVVDLYFQSVVASRYVVLARQAQFWCGMLLRVLLIVLQADLIWFALMAVVDAMLLAAGLVLAYRLRGDRHRWRFERAMASDLLRESWPLLGGALALTAQARIGIIMLGRFSGPEQVAQFAIALRLVELFAFIPGAMRSTFAPALTKAKECGEPAFLAYLTDLYRPLLWGGVAIACVLMPCAPMVVPWLYGANFSEAGLLLAVFAVRIPMLMLRPMRRLFMINAGLTHYALVSALLVAALSVVLNLWLIPSHQAMGAVIAQLLSAFFALVVIDLFHAPARLHLRSLFGAVLTPHRLADSRRLLRPAPRSTLNGR